MLTDVDLEKTSFLSGGSGIHISQVRYEHRPFLSKWNKSPRSQRVSRSLGQSSSS